jgi:hypothetical protein
MFLYPLTYVAWKLLKLVSMDSLSYIFLLKHMWARIYLYNEGAFVLNQVILSRKLLALVKAIAKKSSSILCLLKFSGHL